MHSLNVVLLELANPLSDWPVACWQHHVAITSDKTLCNVPFPTKNQFSSFRLCILDCVQRECAVVKTMLDFSHCFELVRNNTTTANASCSCRIDVL